MNSTSKNNSTLTELSRFFDLKSNYCNYF